MLPDSPKYHTVLAGYFSAQPLFFDGDQQKKPHIRKCVEQPFQQTKAELWDEVTDTLCHLDFIQAKAVAKMTYDLIKDFNDVLEVIPDNAENIRQEKARHTRMKKYNSDLIAYAKGEITELEIPQTVPLWSKERIDYEIERIKTNPNRLDRLKDFRSFMGKEAGFLQNYSISISHLSIQQAWNFANSGPVGDSTKKFAPNFIKELLLKDTNYRPEWNPVSEIFFVLKKHTSWVRTVNMTPDGKKLVTGSNDSTIILWDLITGEAIKIMKGHTSIVRSVSITPDGKRAISGSEDKKCIVWNLITGEIIKTLVGHKGWVTSVSITPDGKYAISGSKNFECILWDLEAGNLLYTFNAYSQIDAVSIFPDASKALIGSTIELFIYDFTKQKKIRILDGHTNSVNCLFLSPDGRKAISGSYDHTCILWDLYSGKILKLLKGHTDYINSVAMTPDCKIAISGSGDKKCIIWDLESGNEIKQLKKHSDAICSVAINPYGNLAVSGSKDEFCLVWNLNADSTHKKILGHTSAINSISVTSTGFQALSGSDDNKIILWDLKLYKTQKILIGHSSYVMTLDITPDGNRAISGSIDNSCIIWDLKKGESIYIVKDYDIIRAVSTTPNGRFAVYCTYTSCSLLDLNTGTWLIRYLNIGEIGFTSVSISPDGKWGIFGLWSEKKCIIFDIINNKKIHILKGHLGKINVVTVSPEGRFAISGSDDSTCIVWDVHTGEIISIFKGHSQSIIAISITSCGKRAISCSEDNTCIIWDLKNGELIGVFMSDSNLTAMMNFPNGIIIGEGSGEINILNGNKNLFCYDKGIVTILQIWDFELQQFLPSSADCPLCGQRFAPTALVLATIEDITKKAGLRSEQSPCLELPDKAWEDPGLLGTCPKCGGELKFNPFIAGGDY